MVEMLDRRSRKEVDMVGIRERRGGQEQQVF